MMKPLQDCQRLAHFQLAFQLCHSDFRAFDQRHLNPATCGMIVCRSTTVSICTEASCRTRGRHTKLCLGTGGTTAICCMISGLTLAIGRKFSVRNFWKDIHDSSANAFVYVGETVRYLLAAPPSPLDRDHSLKAMYGNGMRADIWPQFTKRFNVPVVNEFFNSSEGIFSLLNVCRGGFHVGHVGHHGALDRRRFHNIYIPVEIDHETGNIWRDPRTGFAKRNRYEDGGEILVALQSEKDFSYWRNPEASKKKIECNVFRKGDVYYRTGDALKRDADGRWYFRKFALKVLLLCV